MGEDEPISSTAMKMLQQRIASLKKSSAQVESYRKAIERRPPVPQGTQMMWEEMAADHALLVSWHENAWRAMSANGQDPAIDV